MRYRLSALMPVVAVASAALLAGCAVDGTAVRVPIDYQTGHYATTPDDSGLASPERLAGMRLGEFIPFRGDIDPMFTERTPGTSPKSSLKNLSGFIPGADTVRENRAFRFGYTTSGAGELNGRAVGVYAGVLRYSDAHAAAAAVPAMARRVAAEWRATLTAAGKKTRPRAAPLPGLGKGNTVVSAAWIKPGTTRSLALAPHGSDVLVAVFDGLSGSRTEALLRSTFTTLADAGDAGRGVTVDQKQPNVDLYALAVPYLKTETYLYDGTVAGPKTQAQLADDSSVDYDALRAAGVDAVANRATVLYRAESSKQAVTLRDHFVAAASDAGSSRLASPQDLPDVPCYRVAESSTVECVLADDRYVARATGEDLTEAQQRISAQVVLLQNA
ncbi:hypothetical protein L5G28_09760 [Gordonia sp. HY285]|uniref:DUF7373 family lipoprotein n=1 Tax=Gordonia liuliyuniae TaxID=2911517 RepID=UPI001F1FBB4E|nr:hypothetical protein [Gordonia liuliyuniae]MCF8610440.1 hypothetical protein [Gordonia liuliyuniae]